MREVVTLLGTVVSGRGCWLSNVTFRSAKHSDQGDPLSQPQHLHTDSTRLIETQKHIALFYHAHSCLGIEVFLVLLIFEHHAEHTVLGRFPPTPSSYTLDASPTRIISNYHWYETAESLVPGVTMSCMRMDIKQRLFAEATAGIPPFLTNLTGGAFPRPTGKSTRDLCQHKAAA